MLSPVPIVFLSGCLTGLVADAFRWIFSTTEAAARLPWMPEGGVAGPGWLLTLLACVLGAVFAWLGYTVRGRWRAVILLLGGTVLCFTGSASLALHGAAFDPYPAAAACLLGWLVGWGFSRSPLSKKSDLSATFTGRLSPEMLRKLTQMKPPPDLSGENRPVTVLTCRMLNEGAVRQCIGPAAFLKLAEEFRQRAHSALLSRQALLVPGPTELIQACFGLPVAEKSYARDACQAALLLQSVLREFIGQRNPRGGGALQFGIGLSSGTAASGMLGGDYQILGSVMEMSHQLSNANSSWHTGILTDAETLRLAGPGLLTRPIDSLLSPDFDEPIDLSELVQPCDVEDLPGLRERLAAFAEGVEHLRAGQAAEAADSFDRANPTDGTEDLTVGLFLEAARRSSSGRRADSPTPQPAPKPAAKPKPERSEPRPPRHEARSTPAQPELFPGEETRSAPAADAESPPDGEAERPAPRPARTPKGNDRAAPAQNQTVEHSDYTVESPIRAAESHVRPVFPSIRPTSPATETPAQSDSEGKATPEKAITWASKLESASSTSHPSPTPEENRPRTIKPPGGGGKRRSKGKSGRKK